jgi:hypothetical protein
MNKIIEMVMTVAVGSGMLFGAICAWHFWHMDALVACSLGLIGIGFIGYSFQKA